MLLGEKKIKDNTILAHRIYDSLDTHNNYMPLVTNNNIPFSINMQYISVTLYQTKLTICHFIFPNQQQFLFLEYI